MSTLSHRTWTSRLHIWEGQNFADVDLLVQRRDPRRFTIGCATSNGETVILQWFRNVPEIAQWLRRMEPQRGGRKGPDLIRIKAELEPVLTGVDVHGLDEPSRQAHNRVTATYYRTVWWGDLATLASAADDWSSRFLNGHGLEPCGADSHGLRRIAEALRQRVDGPTP